MHIKAQCEFNVKNGSNKAVNAVIGFPFECGAKAKNLLIKQNDIEVKYSFKKIKTQNECSDLYLWETSFNKNEMKRITVDYIQYVSVSIYAEYPKNNEKSNDNYNLLSGAIIYFNYITSTIQSWKNNVATASFIINLNNFKEVSNVGWEDELRMYYEKYHIHVGYIFNFTIPKTFKYDEKNSSYYLSMNNFNGNDNIYFYNCMLLIPGKAKQVNEYVNKKRLTKEQCIVVRNFYEAVHGKIFDDGEMNKFFKVYSWYNPREDYTFNNIPDEDKKIIKEFDRIISKAK